MFLNKRSQKRRQLYYYLPVLNTETDALLGRVGDITTEGALILSPAPIEIGEQLSLAITIPSELRLGGKEILVNASVQWCSPDVNPDITLIGCRFHDVSPKCQKQIEALITSIGFAAEHSPRPLDAT